MYLLVPLSSNQINFLSKDLITKFKYNFWKKKICTYLFFPNAYLLMSIDRDLKRDRDKRPRAVS